MDYGALFIQRHNLFLIVLLTIFLITVFYKQQDHLLAIIKKNTGFTVLLAIFLNCLFYPSLLQYQAGMMAGKWLNSNNIKQEVTSYKCLSFSFEFYYNGVSGHESNAVAGVNNIPANDSLLVFSSLSNLRSIKNDSANMSILKTFPQFGVSQLNIHFLSHQTRGNVLDTFVIASLKRKNNPK